MAKMRCLKCRALATWAYIPGQRCDVYCDRHVPRGCSCQDDRDEPCCEYMYDEEGWDD
jgi:hypothetical protein